MEILHVLVMDMLKDVRANVTLIHIALVIQEYVLVIKNLLDALTAILITEDVRLMKRVHAMIIMRDALENVTLKKLVLVM